MDFETSISDSIGYSREALAGKWTRWLIFIICSLPLALIQFTFDPEMLRAAKPTDWQDILSLIPWPQIIALCIAGILLSFIISGYLVRIYRGTTPPPEFDTWGSLYLDGIKVTIVDIAWMLPAYILLGIDIAILYFFLINSGDAGSTGQLIGLLLASVLIGLVAVVLIFIGIFYSIIGKIRFARTGSMREGIRFSAINREIQAIGFGTYIIALIILWGVGFIFSMIIGVLSMIPFLGWAIVLVFNPFLTVFSARYISRLYDTAAPEVPSPVTTP